MRAYLVVYHDHVWAVSASSPGAAWGKVAGRRDGVPLGYHQGAVVAASRATYPGRARAPQPIPGQLRLVE